MTVVTGIDLVVDDEPIDRVPGLTIDECTARCSRSETCKSINYCPMSVAEQDCTLSTKSTFDKDVKTERKTFCSNYEKNYKAPPAIPDEKPTEEPTEEKATSGGPMSGVGLFFLTFFMFLLGIGMGIGGWFGYGFVKAHRAEPSGLGLNASSVSFSRHRDEVDTHA